MNVVFLRAVVTSSFVASAGAVAFGSGGARAQDLDVESLFDDAPAADATDKPAKKPDGKAPAKATGKEGKKPAPTTTPPPSTSTAPSAAPDAPASDAPAPDVVAPAAEPPAAAPPPAPTTSTSTGTGFGIALRLDGAVMHGRALDVRAAPSGVQELLSGDGAKGLSGGARLQLTWNFPGDGVLDRMFGTEFEAGYLAEATSGEIPFTQYETINGQTKLTSTTYAYQGLIQSVPLSVGVRARLPVVLPVRIDVALGGMGLWGMSTSSSTVAGAAAPFSVDNNATDLAWGFYAEGGVAWAMGPGELCASYRYESAYLDFNHPAFNDTPGDLGGHHLLLGWRFTP